MQYPLDIIKIRENQNYKFNPISNTFGKVRNNGNKPHQGWDLEAPVGTPVYAIASGKLEAGGSTADKKNFGLYAILEFLHQGKTYYAFYGHLSKHLMTNVCVPEGAMIGLTGSSGNASNIPVSEAHLHFEIRTIKTIPKGLGLHGRIDPGEILGYEVYSSRNAPLTR